MRVCQSALHRSSNSQSIHQILLRQDENYIVDFHESTLDFNANLNLILQQIAKIPFDSLMFKINAQMISLNFCVKYSLNVFRGLKFVASLKSNEISHGLPNFRIVLSEIGKYLLNSKLKKCCNKFYQLFQKCNIVPV